MHSQTAQRNQSATMARLAAALLCLTLTLESASRSAAQEQGFYSINCGGEAYIDPTTKIMWNGDPFNKSMYQIGKAGSINKSLPNVTNVMKSLRYFPKDSHNRRKYCYHFQVSIGDTYLLRASFLYGNYDGLNQPPRFVLILNQDVWTDVTISASTNPVVHELIFSNKDREMNICLAPHLKSTNKPFISTLEIRPLDNSTFINIANPTESALSNGYGLLLWRRINYGATTKDAIRYPNDPRDRIWEANMTGPKLQSKKTSLDDVSLLPAVMSTAITSIGNHNLSFVYPAYGGIAGFRVRLYFQELVDVPTSSPREVYISFPNSTTTQSTLVPITRNLTHPTFDKNLVLPPNFQIYLTTTSPLGSLLNAIELFHWTPQPLSLNGTFPSDVYAIKKIQAHFNVLQIGQGDPCLPKGYEWTWIRCSMDTPSRIWQINLSSFNLTGDIPLAINNLTSLQKIDLSNNKLSGDIPTFSLLLDLKYLDLHSNNLSGELSSSLVLLPKLTKLDVSNNNLCGNPPSFEFVINFTYSGNKRLCQDVTCNCISSMASNFSTTPNLPYKKNKRRKYTISIFSLGALYILSVIAFLFICIYKARRYNKRKDTKSASLEIIGNKKGGVDLNGLSFVSKMFTYKEISDATLNFTTMLGEGGFGKVYHGLLPTGEAIAVKMLVDVSKQGLKEFFNEVAILSKVRHKNLVSLLGYCVENTYMLIYEYIAKGNIRDLIYGELESTDKPLPWTTRLHIALDASQGLDYLHTGCDPTIIHRDVKSSNILLSEKMQAKVADFGLSRLKEVDITTSHVSTVNVVGTIGYLDPVYNATSRLTDKSDVYSFGIVLLELICGRAPIDMFNTPPHIAEWASESVVQGKVGEIVDPVLANGYKMESMRKVVDVALQCVDNDRSKRPKMSEVSQLLQNALEVEMDPNYSPQDFSGSFST